MRDPNDPDIPEFKPEVPTGPRLTDLFGMAEARQWGEALAREFPLFRQGRIPWSDTDHACILHGPPGTGKTTFARAVAHLLNLPHIIVSFANWQGAPGGHLGTTIEAMKKDFALAIKHAPCVLSVEEFDSIPARTADGHNPSYFNAINNAILTELDAAIKVGGLIIIGTCNHPGMLDPAITRPGRMDRLIAVNLPNAEELKGIVRFHLKGAELATLDGPYFGCLRDIAALCTGFSGAEVEQAVRGARRLARASGATLSLVHFEDVLDPPAQRLNHAERRRIARHEAGHVVAAWKLLNPTEIAASIVARGGSAGRVTLRTAPGPRTRRTVEAWIIHSLAGRAAEQLLLAEVSELSGGTDKRSDLAQATRLASEAVLALGFSAERRLLWTSNTNDLTAWREDGPIAQEIKRVLDDGYAAALSLVATHRDKVEAIADALLARRVLSHDEIKAIMTGSTLPSPAPRLPAPAFSTRSCSGPQSCLDDAAIARALKRMEGYRSPGFAASPEREHVPLQAPRLSKPSRHDIPDHFRSPPPGREPLGYHPVGPLTPPDRGFPRPSFDPYHRPYFQPDDPYSPVSGPQQTLQHRPLHRASRPIDIDCNDEGDDGLLTKVSAAIRRLCRRLR